MRKAYVLFLVYLCNSCSQSEQTKKDIGIDSADRKLATQAVATEEPPAKSKADIAPTANMFNKGNKETPLKQEFLLTKFPSQSLLNVDNKPFVFVQELNVLTSTSLAPSRIFAKCGDTILGEYSTYLDSDQNVPKIYRMSLVIAQGQFICTGDVEIDLEIFGHEIEMGTSYWGFMDAFQSGKVKISE